MSLVWLAISALLAGPDGPTPRSVREPGRLAACSVVPGIGPGPTRLTAVGRGLGHRRGPGPWPGGCVDLFDAEESEEPEESWIVPWDLLGSVPAARLAWGWPRSTTRSRPVDGLDPPSPAAFPLRC